MLKNPYLLVELVILDNFNLYILTFCYKHLVIHGTFTNQHTNSHKELAVLIRSISTMIAKDWNTKTSINKIS